MDSAKLAALIASKKQAMKRTERAAGFNPGKNRIRLLPGWRKADPEVFFHDFGQHFVKDEADQIQAVYVCANDTYAKPCSCCNALRALIASAPDDATSNTLAKSRSGKTTLVNALFLDSSEPNTPKVTSIPNRLMSQFLELITDHGFEVVLDPDKSHEIIVTRTGTGKNDTVYTATMVLKPGLPIPKAVLDKINDLDEYVKQESTEGENRALAAMNTIAGLLPAPSMPATTVSAIAAPPTAAIGAPRRAAAPAAATADTALDTELDDLLGELPEQ